MDFTSKKIIFTIIAISAAIASFVILSSVFSGRENAYFSSTQEILNQRLFTAAAIFGITKLVSGVINVLQNVQIEAGLVFAGMSFAPMELLSPINDTINKLSNLFLFAMGAITLQKTLLLVTGWISFKLLIPAAMVLLTISIWSEKYKITLKNAAALFLLTAALTFSFIPVSAKISSFAEKNFFADILQESTEELMKKEAILTTIEEEYSGTKKSTWDKIKENSSLATLEQKIKNTANAAAEYAKSTINDLLNAFIVMIITTLLIPIATLYIMWKIVKKLFISMKSFINPFTTVLPEEYNKNEK